MEKKDMNKKKIIQKKKIEGKKGFREYLQSL